MEMFLATVAEKIKISVLCSVTCYRKSCCFWDFFSLSLSLSLLTMAPSLPETNQPFYSDLIFAKGMVASVVAQRFDLFILTCLRILFMTRHNRQNPSGRVISPSQRPLPDNKQHSQQTNRQTSMTRVEFEPTISAGERPKTYALHRAATGIGVLGIVKAILLSLPVILPQLFVLPFSSPVSTLLRCTGSPFCKENSFIPFYCNKRFSL